jgi:hypothetical protein
MAPRLLTSYNDLLCRVGVGGGAILVPINGDLYFLPLADSMFLFKYFINMYEYCGNYAAPTVYRQVLSCRVGIISFTLCFGVCFPVLKINTPQERSPPSVHRLQLFSWA